MTVVIGLAIGLIIGGLVICLLSKQAGNAALATLFWWAGAILAVFGLILLITPALNWVYVQIRAILGQ